MSGYVPMYVFLILLFVIGGFLPLVIGGFVDTSVINPDSFTSGFIDFFETGLTVNLPLLPDLDLDLFFWLPDFIHDFLLTQFTAFSYIPNGIAAPLLIVLAISLIYAVASFIPTVSA